MTEQNVNPKEAATVPGQMLFSNAEKALADALTTPNVNTNIFELITQYWAETTYPQESQYDLGNRNIPLNWWSTLYSDVIEDLDRSISVTQQQQTDPTLLPEQKAAFVNNIAIAKILKFYSYSILVNTYGNIPYTDALAGAQNTTPVYDDQKTVYYAILDSLDEAINTLDPESGSFIDANDDADLIYHGDVSKWYKLANSLKLKLGVIIADYDMEKAKSVVEAAAPNVFTSNDDNALLVYTSTPPNVNPIWANLVQSGRNDFVVTSVIIDSMVNKADPRLPFYFTTVGGVYKGGTYGTGNTYRNFSHTSDATKDPTFPADILDYAEVEFLLAEASARNMSVGSTAASHYANAVTASITFWGGSEGEASTYLKQASVAFDAANWKKSIGVQAWISYYLRGFDEWIEWRRLGFPQLQAPAKAKTAIPVRYTYPSTESNLNLSNYEDASAAIGGDDVTTKLFWDVN